MRSYSRWLSNAPNVLADSEDKLAACDEALEVASHVRDPDPELLERLYRITLGLRPDDREIRVRLAQLLRDSERYG